MEDRAAVVESFEAIGEVSSADPRLDTSSVGHTQEAQVDVDVSTHAGDTEGGSRSGSNRLSSIVPTLGRMANTAHMLSTPYLTYAAMASQEAARYTADHAQRYVDKMQAQHRKGEAPPGLVDPAKVDWSGVGARFCSLSWYERQLVDNSSAGGGVRMERHKRPSPPSMHQRDVEELAASCPSDKTIVDESSAGWKDHESESGGGESGDGVVLSPHPRTEGSDDSGVRFGGQTRRSDASVIATLKDLDPWVTSPLFDDEYNNMGSRLPPFAGGSDRSIGSSTGAGAGDLRDCPSPVRVISGNGLLDRLCESWEGCPAATKTSAEQTVATVGSRSEIYVKRSASGDIGPGKVGEVMSREAPAEGACEGMTHYELDADHARRDAPLHGALVAEEGVAVGWRMASIEGEIHCSHFARAAPQAEDELLVAEARDYSEAAAAGSAFTGKTPDFAMSVKDGSIAMHHPSGQWDTLASSTLSAQANVEAISEMDVVTANGVPLFRTASSQELLLDWLRREASMGDEEAQFHLAQLFSPPRFEMKMECRKCGETFGVTRYRHHCRHCGGSFCHEHSWHMHPIPKLGLPTPQRVCTPCKHTLELEDWRDRVEWRLQRVQAYLEGGLIEYFDIGVDTGVDKALRVVDGAIYVAKAAPLGTAVKVSVEVMDLLMKYGTAGVAGLVLRREFVEAVDVLKRLSGVDKKWPMSVHEMTAAMYYLLAQRRGERGADPNGEHEAHRGCSVISDEELSFLRAMSALPLHFAYTKTALELQVLCNTTGWLLVFHKAESRFHQPAFSLLACRATMTAALVIRGTGSVHDVITDIQAIPVPFPPPRNDGTAPGEEADGWSEMPPADTVACCGMARAAEWLQREVVHHLVKLHREGHKIILLGHSLGGGVAALTGCLMKEVIPDIQVIAFATPACADKGVSELCESFCTSVVLHDDVVPRVTPQAVRALLKDALCTKEGWVQHLYDDWDAVVGRAKGLWAPRWRSTSFGGVIGRSSTNKPSSPSNQASSPADNAKVAANMPGAKNDDSSGGRDGTVAVLGTAAIGLLDAQGSGSDLAPISGADSKKDEVPLGGVTLSAGEDRDQMNMMARITHGQSEQVEKVEPMMHGAKQQQEEEEDEDDIVIEDKNDDGGEDDDGLTIESHCASEDQDVNGWGGRGQQHSSRNSDEQSTAAGAHGPSDSDRDVAARAGGLSSISGTDGGGGGGSGGGWRQSASRRVGWTRARWSAVDVRAVQNRISRMVDDTSARIRSSVVVKDLQSAAVGLPRHVRPGRGDSLDASLDKGAIGNAAPVRDSLNDSMAHVEAEDGVDVGAEEEAEVLEELPLPELYVPGRLIHIYSQRGAYRGCEIPRDHECMRSIPMYGNMLADHGSQAYFDALEEVAAVRIAEANGQAMPEWVPFSASEECQLCKADFSWASTSSSEERCVCCSLDVKHGARSGDSVPAAARFFFPERCFGNRQADHNILTGKFELNAPTAQRQRDKHNCRMCGLLVCHPCSRHRKPLPRMGVLEPSRVCDRCYYGTEPSRVAR